MEVGQQPAGQYFGFPQRGQQWPFEWPAIVGSDQLGQGLPVSVQVGQNLAGGCEFFAEEELGGTAAQYPHRDVVKSGLVTQR